WAGDYGRLGRGSQPRMGQTDSRLRPLARRALMTARPPRVFMRTRKPCVRLRRVTEGWNVRFMVVHPKIKELLRRNITASPLAKDRASQQKSVKSQLVHQIIQA